ncbi:MAG: hypothetical protein EG826_02420 [Deltaproteobacteria bacterium]|nr:hypothetical protein [Deltaproteobacteria bacterium]
MLNGSKRSMISLGLAGCLAGGFIGYLLRPSAFMIGQLPFHHVITRGGSLQGVERVFMSLARESFNTMMIGAAIGFVAGVMIGYFIGQKRS